MSSSTQKQALGTRQSHILALWVQGAKHQHIADLLGLKKDSVDQVLRHIMWKLELEDRPALKAWALTHGYDKVQVHVSDEEVRA